VLAQNMKFVEAKATLALERELLLLNQFDNKIMHPVIVTRITDALKAHIPLASIDSILSTDFTALENNGKQFRCRYSVIASKPAIGQDFKADSISALVKV
jgi:hypothetical protein